VTGRTEPLASRLGHTFADPALLTLALTHRSWCAEHAGDESNERLEFLGDSVLGLAVTDHLIRAMPGVAEGHLAKVRASVVSAPTLAAIAHHLGLGEDLRLGRGELLSGGRSKHSILADALEAVFGAVYLDAGWETARTLIIGLLRDHIADAATGPGGHDYKTRLQELAARRFDGAPTYVLTESGPDHDKRFTAVVHLGGVAVGQGEGTSKKQAEQDAARRAWAALDPPPTEPEDTVPRHHADDDRHEPAGRANA
jgi:ribonuclease-3